MWSIKMKNFSFLLFNYKTKLFKKRQNDIVTIKKMRIWFLILFSKIWKIGEKYRTDRISNKTKPCSIPMSTLKNGKEKLFQRYQVFLPIK